MWYLICTRVHDGFVHTVEPFASREAAMTYAVSTAEVEDEKDRLLIRAIVEQGGSFVLQGIRTTVIKQTDL